MVLPFGMFMLCARRASHSSKSENTLAAVLTQNGKTVLECTVSSTLTYILKSKLMQVKGRV